MQPGDGMQGQPPQVNGMQGQPPQGYGMQGQPPQGNGMQAQPPPGYGMQGQSPPDSGAQDIPQICIPTDYDESTAPQEVDQSCASSFYAPSAAQPPLQYQQQPAGPYGVIDSQAGRSVGPITGTSTGASSSVPPSAYTGTGTTTAATASAYQMQTEPSTTAVYQTHTEPSTTAANQTHTEPSTTAAAHAPGQPAHRTDVVVSPHSTLKRCCTVILCAIFLAVVGIVGFLGAKLYMNQRNAEPKRVKTEQGPPDPPAIIWTTHVPYVPRKLTIICTAGAFEDAGHVPHRGFPCDYLIYTDVVLHEGGITPIYGNNSWYWYKQILETYPQLRNGVSFTLSEGEQTDGTIDRIEFLLPYIRLTITQNFQALGAFDCDPSMIKMANIKKFFQALYIAKEGMRDLFYPMIFMGIIIRSFSIAHDVAPEVSKIRGLDVVIFQTHIVLKNEYNGDKAECYTYPISATGHTNLFNTSQPTLSVAVEAVKMTRDAGGKFRVMFSSTMGVMVYTSITHGYLSTFRQPCRSYQMADFDVVCNDDTTKDTVDDDLCRVAYTKPGQFMYSYDDNDTIKAKLMQYVPRYTDGWCMFDISHDVYWACDVKADPLARVVAARKLLNTMMHGPEPTVPGK